jgi:hypothetical protein
MDGTDDIWKAGASFNPGGSPVSFPENHFVNSSISDPAGQQVYQTAQVGEQVYNLSNIHDGKYLVRLHFSDARVNVQNEFLRIRINNEYDGDLDNFCIANQAGGYSRVLIKEKEITVSDGNGITIQIENVTDEGALINGIEIRSFVDANAPVYFDQTVSLAPKSDLFILKMLQPDDFNIATIGPPIDEGEDILLSEYSDPFPIVADLAPGYKFVEWVCPDHVNIRDKSSPFTYVDSINDDATISIIYEEDNGGGGGGQTPTLGDVNNDNSINIIDALLIAQYYVGQNPRGFIYEAADVNCDGSINILDALLIAQYYVGLITGFC